MALRIKETAHLPTDGLQNRALNPPLATKKPKNKIGSAQVIQLTRVMVKKAQNNIGDRHQFISIHKSISNMDL